MLKTHLFYASALFLVLGLASCKEDKKNDPAPSNPVTTRPTALNTDVKNESAKSTPSGGGNVTFGGGTTPIGVLPPSDQKANLNSSELADYQRIVGNNVSSNGKVSNSTFLAWFVDGIIINGIDFTNDPAFDFFDFYTMFFFEDDIYITFFYDEDISDWDWDWGYYYIDADLTYMAFDLNSPFEEVWRITDVVPFSATETDMYMDLYDPVDSLFIEILFASYEVE